MERSRGRKCGFRKAGDYVEVRVPLSATYQDVVEAASLAVGIDDCSTSEEELSEHSQRDLSLFRIDGTRIPNSPLDLSTPWTIDSYMSTFPSYQRSGMAVKLGVGYLSPVSIYIQLICYIKLSLLLGKTIPPTVPLIYIPGDTTTSIVSPVNTRYI